MDKQRLIKLLNLSSSKNEGEALSAIRKANLILDESSSDWENILNDHSEIDKSEREGYAILYYNLQKERAYSKELKDELKFSKMISKYLGIFVFFLIVVVVLK